MLRVTLGTTKDASIEAVRCLLELPSMEARHKMKQVKVYFKTMQNPTNPLHDAVKEEKVMYGSSRTVNPACVQSRRAQARKDRDIKPYYKTLLSENMGTGSAFCGSLSKSMMTLFSVTPVCHGHGGGCGVRS